MATITLTFGPKTKSYTVSAQSVQRIQDWALASYPTIPDPTWVSSDHPGARGIPQITNPEPVISMMDGLIQGIKDGVKGYERQVAIQAVPPAADVS